LARPGWGKGARGQCVKREGRGGRVEYKEYLGREGGKEQRANCSQRNVGADREGGKEQRANCSQRNVGADREGGKEQRANCSQRNIGRIRGGEESEMERMIQLGRGMREKREKRKRGRSSETESETHMHIEKGRSLNGWGVRRRDTEIAKIFTNETRLKPITC